jgi:glycosyltransferase involved in cell wall biosynthesis
VIENGKMNPDRLRILFVSLYPASPPRYGGQRRIEGLMKALAQRHEISAVALVSPDRDPAASKRAMLEYCGEVVLVPSRRWEGAGKRLLQARSLFSPHSFENRFYALPAFQRALDELLTRRSCDIVNLSAGSFLTQYHLRQAPPGNSLPLLVLDEHNVEFDVQRQMAGVGDLARRFHNSVNWPKLQREEVESWRSFDGVTFTSAPDELRAHAFVPSLRSAVIPNAVDIRYFRSRPDDPSPDGRTVLFFGAINYYPNVDGLLFFLREVWPRVAESHPKARLRIVGQHPTPEILACQGARIEVAGLVDDVRPRLASAAVVIVPLRVGGGTRFKVLEAMAMAKPVVSTTIGAEGIDATSGRNILIADTPQDFAAAVGRTLDDPGLGRQLGREGRALVEGGYSWDAVAQRLERFFRGIGSGGDGSSGPVSRHAGFA